MHRFTHRVTARCRRPTVVLSAVLLRTPAREDGLIQAPAYGGRTSDSEDIALRVQNDTADIRLESVLIPVELDVLRDPLCSGVHPSRRKQASPYSLRLQGDGCCDTTLELHPWSYVESTARWCDRVQLIRRHRRNRPRATAASEYASLPGRTLPARRRAGMRQASRARRSEDCSASPP